MLDRSNPYFKQVELLVRILTIIGEVPVFALKGGTAINLFYQNLPRLSVDIDLVYVPIKGRNQSLSEISEQLKIISQRIHREISGAKISFGYLNKSNYLTKIIISYKDSSVKIETSPILRGTVHPVSIQKVSDLAMKIFGFAKANVVSFYDLYAGKMVAALDRQHPRDLFDVKYLLEHGISEELKKTFVVYLISHNRSIREILFPNLIDIEEIFFKHFLGMTIDKVSLDELIDVRKTLIKTIHRNLNDNDKAFILNFKKGKPNWSYFSVDHISELPAIKWKQYNLNKMDIKKRKKLIDSLEKDFNNKRPLHNYL